MSLAKTLMANTYKGCASMLLRHIISETGLNASDYPKTSEMPITLYDRKHREITEEKDFNFGKKLFSANLDSLAKFRAMLEFLEESEAKKDFSGRLTDDFLIIYVAGKTYIFRLF